MAISSAGGFSQYSGNVISPRFASRLKKEQKSKKVKQRKVNKPKRGK